MKYKDIPKFPSVNYRVDKSLRYVVKDIEDYVTNYGFDMNPDFQRGHVWTEAQQIAFIEYMLSGGEGINITANHPGWMSYWKGPFVLLDGKQRLTAMLRFMKNEIPAYGYFAKDYERIPDVTYSFRVLKLRTRAEVLEYYLSFNAGGTVHSPEEIERVRILLAQEKSVKDP